MRRRAASRRVVVPLCLALLLACGCGLLQAPPLEVTQRESLVGLGRILQITNTSDETLENVELRFENPNGDVRHHELPRLEGGESIEIGWRKLGGFEVDDAARVQVRAAGFGRVLRLDLGR